MRIDLVSSLAWEIDAAHPPSCRANRLWRRRHAELCRPGHACEPPAAPVAQ